MKLSLSLLAERFESFPGSVPKIGGKKFVKLYAPVLFTQLAFAVFAEFVEWFFFAWLLLYNFSQGSYFMFDLSLGGSWMLNRVFIIYEQFAADELKMKYWNCVAFWLIRATQASPMLLPVAVNGVRRLEAYAVWLDAHFSKGVFIFFSRFSVCSFL